MGIARSFVRSFVRSSLLVAAVFAIQGCTLATIKATGPVPISLTPPPPEAHVVGHFSRTIDVIGFLWGPYFQEPAIGETVAEEVRKLGGTGAVNVSMKTDFGHRSFGACLVDTITLGIVQHVAYIIEGDAVKTAK